MGVLVKAADESADDTHSHSLADLRYGNGSNDSSFSAYVNADPSGKKLGGTMSFPPCGVEDRGAHLAHHHGHSHLPQQQLHSPVQHGALGQPQPWKTSPILAKMDDGVSPMQSSDASSLADDGSSGQATPLCAGCRLRIVDKFYLFAVERKWHASCLKCVECGVELENQLSCFERNGHIFCKEDYLRMYPQRSRQCSRCALDVQPSDLVMKARHCIFHIDCFRCATCDIVLRKGDLFGMFDDVLYCRMHFELLSAAPPHHPLHPHPPHPQMHAQHPPDAHTPDHLFSPGANGFFAPSPYGPHLPPPQGPPLHPGDPWFPPGEFPLGAAAGEYPYDNNNEPMLKKRRGRKKRKVVDGFPPMSGYMDGGFPGGLDGGPQAKTKRARTSFKHHQLRIMKAHFQINQNPDSRELKMLSQKTGLDKKVLQVWFQNARAKWRRTKAQDCAGGGGSGGSVAPAAASSGSSGSAGEDASMGVGMGGMGGLGMAEGASPSSSSDCSTSMIPCC